MTTSRAIIRTFRRELSQRSTTLPKLASRSSTIASHSLFSRRHGSTLPPRSSAFTRPSADHVRHLRSFLSSPTSLLSTIDGSATLDDLASYNNDWMNKYHGKGPIVVKPKSTEEVSAVMKYCYEQGLAIVPQGGNTGLVGELSSYCQIRQCAHD